MENRNINSFDRENAKRKVIETLEDVNNDDIAFISLNTLEKMHATDRIVCEYYRDYTDSVTVANVYTLRNTEYIQTVVNTLYETARELILDIPTDELNLSANNPSYNKFTQFSNHISRLFEQHVLSAEEEDARILAIENAIWISKLAFNKGDLNSTANIMASLDSIFTIKKLSDLPISKKARKFVIEWQKNYDASKKIGKINLAAYYKDSRVNGKPIIPILGSYAGVMEVGQNASFLSGINNKGSNHQEDSSETTKGKLSTSKGKEEKSNAKSDLIAFQLNLNNNKQEAIINENLKLKLTQPILTDHLLLDAVERKEIQQRAENTKKNREAEYESYKKQHQAKIKSLINEIKEKQNFLRESECSTVRKYLRNEVQILQEKLKAQPLENDSMRGVNRSSTKISSDFIDDMLDTKRHKHPKRKDAQFAESSILKKFSDGVYIEKHVRRHKTSISQVSSHMTSRLSISLGLLSPKPKQKVEQKHRTLYSINDTDKLYSSTHDNIKTEKHKEKEGRLVKANRSQSFG